ncbi:TPA: hypothetical protein ACQQ5N_002941 [Pseudomonas aeruginosa]|nr:hypothetical protein [Pseudomonas aeruginosa]
MSQQNTLELHVIVATELPQQALHQLDQDVAGIYSVTVESRLTQGIQSGVALDVFHDNQPIKMLEDFTITVVDPSTGMELVESDGYEHGTQRSAGRYNGKLDAGEMDLAMNGPQC